MIRKIISFFSFLKSDRIYVFLGFLCFLACGKKSSSAAETTTTAAGKLQLAVVAANFQASTTALNLADASNSAPPFRATSIFSGAPTSFTIYVKEIKLTGTTGAGVISAKIFEDGDGKPVAIDGSKVDLSALFTNFTCFKSDGSPLVLKANEKCECGVDAAGAVIKKENIVDEKTGKSELKCNFGKMKTAPVGVVDISTGTFTKLQVKYSSKADIKGCLTGYFRTNSTGVGDTSVLHKYCTKQAGSLFAGDGTATLATFENQAPEIMDTALTGVGGPNAFTADQSNLDIEYPIEGGLKIEEGKSGRLSLVIDTNRMLRFEAANRDDAPTLKTGWPKTRPYFFSTVFKDSSFVFAGAPGEIRGYSWSAYACKPSATPCKNVSTNNIFYIEGWLTTILNPAGKPIVMSYMPDDDSTLTVVKGNNLLTSNDPSKGMTSVVDPNSVVTNANGTVTYNYSLGTDKGSITLPSEPTAKEQSVEGTFAGFQSSGGEFKLTRKL